MQRILYRTIAINNDGVNGTVFLDDGTKHIVSSPLKNEVGTNPEQLLAASFSTCLSETLRVVLLQNRKRNPYKVEVSVALIADEIEKGYQFLVNAKLAVKDVDLAETALFLAETKKRCPVSRLLLDHKNVSYEAVLYWLVLILFTWSERDYIA